MPRIFKVSPVKLDLLVFLVFLELTDATELMVCLVFLVWSVIPVHEGECQSSLHLNSSLKLESPTAIPVKVVSREKKVKPHKSSTLTTRKVKRVSQVSMEELEILELLV
jgi:hypothetical protein